MDKLRNLFESYTGQKVSDTEELNSSGSNRRYFRLKGGNISIIGVIGTSREENNAFISLSAHFLSKGIKVPKVLAVSEDGMRYIQEDLGDDQLYKVVSQGRESGEYSSYECRLLCRAMEMLPKLQFKGAEGLDWSVCYPEPAFNERMILFDLNYFKYCFLKATGLEFNEVKLQDDFERLKTDLMQDMGDFYAAANNTSTFPVDENGDPDFSHRQDLPQEPIDATRQVYIAWNQLVTNENLSAEERYAYRRDVFTNLPDMDWQEFGKLGGIDSSGTIFALLDWLSQQEHYSSGDIYFIQRGYAARGIDGAYAEDYCYLLSRALFSDPVAYAKALARSTADDEAVQTLIMGGTAYGADYYPADCETAVSALDAAINANALTAEETGWAKLLRYYLANPNDGYYADYPKTPAELEN